MSYLDAAREIAEPGATRTERSAVNGEPWPRTVGRHVQRGAGVIERTVAERSGGSAADSPP